MCVYLQIFLCMSEQSDTYFSIMAKHTKDGGAFHYAQQSVVG